MLSFTKNKDFVKLVKQFFGETAIIKYEEYFDPRYKNKPVTYLIKILTEQDYETARKNLKDFVTICEGIEKPTDCNNVLFDIEVMNEVKAN